MTATGTPVILLASLLWGVVHSLLAGDQARAWAVHAFGPSAPRWYRLGYNLFALLSFLPLLALVALLPDRSLYILPAPWLQVFLLVQAAAAALLVIAVLQTDTLAFIGLRQLFERTPRPAGLVTGGLYRIVRHPLYTAGLLFIWFTPRMSANQLAAYAALSIYIVIGAYFEERKLLREHGQAYAEYRRRTAMLIPFIF